MIGQSLQVGTLPYTIIGVAPEGFVGIAGGQPPVAFIPITTVAANDDRWSANTYFTSFNWDWMSVIVRRKPGVTEIVASADLSNAFLQSRNAQRVANPAVAPPDVLETYKYDSLPIVKSIAVYHSDREPKMTEAEMADFLMLPEVLPEEIRRRLADSLSAKTKASA